MERKRKKIQPKEVISKPITIVPKKEKNFAALVKNEFSFYPNKLEVITRILKQVFSTNTVDILQVGQKKVLKDCIYDFRENSHKLVKTSVSCAIVSGKCREPFKFCANRNEVILVQGSDCGDNVAACLFCLVNREKGSSTHFAIPFGFYENDSEKLS